MAQTRQNREMTSGLSTEQLIRHYARNPWTDNYTVTAWVRE